ncbi:bifunctional ADP-dependent NAD(P)H-hydrate dehydratase/NAD(P)H-hydrate epimerase [Leptospira sp. WS92.C1]
MEIKFSEYSESLFYETESRNLDRKTIELTGISGSHLMGFAALSIYQKYEKKFTQYDTIQILCGSGNNGGDGLALAFFLIQAGKSPQVYLKEGKLSEESLYYKGLFLKTGGTIFSLETYSPTESGEKILIVDALLGTGFQPPLKNPYDTVVSTIQKQKSRNPERIFILSIDTVSGFTEESKLPFEPNALAEIGMKKWRNRFLTETVSKTFHKIGFPIGKNPQENRDLNTGKILWKQIPKTVLKKCLKRENDSHKYKNGAALLIGGSEGMSGAVISSLLAFHQLGGGISLLLTPSEKTVRSVLKRDPSLMIDQLGETSKILARPFVKKASVILIGPGLKTEECPVVDLPEEKNAILDAGAILAYKNHVLHDRVLFTPHTGELEVLLETKIHSVEQGISLCIKYSQKHRVNILWKRHSSFLIDPQGSIFLWNKPEPKLAVMGTGDLLAGILAFFLSRGFAIPEAVQLSHSLLTRAARKIDGFSTATKIRKRLIL